MRMKYKDATKKKSSFLYVVHYDISLIKNDLVKLLELIQEYNPFMPSRWKWGRVREHNRTAFENLKERRNRIFTNLSIIKDLIKKDPMLVPRKFVRRYIDYSGDLFVKISQIEEPRYETPGFLRMIGEVRKQIEKLDSILSHLDEQMVTSKSRILAKKPIMKSSKKVPSKRLSNK